jgi:leader peptidase (prepilin peptidase)/N-methyltransferase
MSIASQSASIKLAASRQKVPFAICAAAACAVSLYVAPGPIGVCGALLALLMAAIAYRDAHDFIIPDEYSAAASVFALAVAVYFVDGDAIWAIGAALARAGVLASAFLALRAAYHRFRGRHGLGLGDVKLAGVAVAIEIAAFSALAAVLIEQLITRRKPKATTRLPFGLFLAPSIWIGWLLQTALPWPWP